MNKYKARHTNKRFLKSIKYLNTKIFECTATKFKLYQSYKQIDPANKNFNMDLSTVNFDGTTVMAACRSINYLVTLIVSKLDDDFIKGQYAEVGTDLYTLFCTLYKSFYALTDVVYFLGTGYMSDDWKLNLKLYQDYFDHTLKQYFLRDFKSLKHIFSRS